MVSVAKGMSPSHPFDYNHVQVWLMRLQGFPLASVDDCGILFEQRYGFPFLSLASFWSGQIKKEMSGLENLFTAYKIFPSNPRGNRNVKNIGALMAS